MLRSNVMGKLLLPCGKLPDNAFCRANFNPKYPGELVFQVLFHVLCRAPFEYVNANFLLAEDVIRFYKIAVLKMIA